METEKRIIQLEGRLTFLRQFIPLFFSSNGNYKRAANLIKTCRAEYDRLTNQRSF